MSEKKQRQHPNAHKELGFDTVKAFLAHYGTPFQCYYSLLNRGVPSIEALQSGPGEIPKHTIYDHLGKKYPNKSTMCRAYGITKQLFKQRRREGWSLERNLTTPKRTRRRRSSEIKN